MNTRKLALAAFAQTGIITLLMGNWVLIENFEDQDRSRWAGDSQLLQAGIHTFFQGLFEIVEDPIGGNESFVGRFSGGPAEGDNFGLPGAVAHSIDLPQPIERSGVATLFFQLGVATWESDNAFGLTHRPAWQQFWSDMETVMRYEFRNATFDVYNQSRFETFGFPEEMTWYKVWKVIDAAANTYKIYIQGGLDYEEQTAVVSFDGNSTFVMRNRASDPIVRFGIIHNINSIEVSFPREPLYLDDLYIDYSGENLAVPSGGSIEPSKRWAGLPVDAGGYVDTGALLGKIYVGLNRDWVYAAQLGHWIRLSEADYHPSGVWVYLTDPSASLPPLAASGATDTGDWLGLLYRAQGDWFYAFDAAMWLLLPAAAIEANGAWVFVPAALANGGQ